MVPVQHIAEVGLYSKTLCTGVDGAHFRQLPGPVRYHAPLCLAERVLAVFAKQDDNIRFGRNVVAGRIPELWCLKKREFELPEFFDEIDELKESEPSTHSL